MKITRVIKENSNLAVLTLSKCQNFLRSELIGLELMEIVIGNYSTDIMELPITLSEVGIT